MLKLINSFPLIMLLSLTCTIIIELLFALLIGIRDKKDLINVLLVNIITNPIVTSLSFTIDIYYRNYYLISIIILELLAWLTESLIYRKYLNYKKINPFIISLILNAASYFIGIIINNIIW
ncbi:MAG TPA: hypothetical protein PKG93_05065 [Bacilli bacterium]|nr:hypothetical protein [Bacilli bacterium]